MKTLDRNLLPKWSVSGLSSLLLGVGLLLPSTAQAQDYRILAGGDSITYGYLDQNNDGAQDTTDPYSYRRQFTQRLDTAGILYNMVGSETDDFGNTFDGNHEGKGGREIAGTTTNVDNLSGVLSGSYLNNYTPDVALIMIGVNDLIGIFHSDPGEVREPGGTVAGTYSEHQALISQLLNDVNGPEHIFVSTLTPTFNFVGANFANDIQNLQPQIDAFNALLLDDFAPGGLYENSASVHLVRGDLAFDPNQANLPDGLHLSESSYNALGDAFADAFLAAIPEPSSLVLLGFGGMALLGRRRARRA
jgi:lysophospholipase L1-like esterase